MTLFGDRREVTRHDVASDPNNWTREQRRDPRRAAVPSEVPSPAVLRRRPRHRDVLVPADCYRATTTQSDVPLYAAADAQVAEAAADARAVVSMLRLYVVCCLVCFFQF